jgi:hypothetical protein
LVGEVDVEPEDELDEEGMLASFWSYGMGARRADDEEQSLG